MVYSAKNYLITSETLRFCLNLGLVVENLHWALEYQRGKPLAPFIEQSITDLILSFLKIFSYK